MCEPCQFGPHHGALVALRSSQGCLTEFIEQQALLHMDRFWTSTSARQNARQAFIRCRLLREKPEGQRATYLFVSERMASVAGGRKGRRLRLLGPQPHAAALDRLQARQRWPRHTRDPGLPRPSV